MESEQLKCCLYIIKCKVYKGLEDCFSPRKSKQNRQKIRLCKLLKIKCCFWRKIQGTYFKISALYFKIYGLCFLLHALCFSPYDKTEVFERVF